MNKPAKDLTPGREGRGFPEITIHLIVCAIILSLPLLTINFRNYSGANVWNLYLRFTPFPVLLLVLFYLNYLWLIPRRLFCGRTAEFFFWNFSLVLLFCYVLQLVPILFHPEPSDAAGEAARAMRPPRRRMLPPRWIFVAKDFISFSMGILVAVIICMNARWRAAENAREKAEKSRAEAELRNLRNQLSPHFLLNTLNNIYALIVFDTDKAQQAVLDLSRLLRHVLYENPTELVPLSKEVAFIQNYIDLMRIRLGPHVELRTDYRIAPESNTPVAPLLLISLIENAFKHGVSSDKPSFIRIRIEENAEKGEVRCLIENSNFPKQQNDKSGSGIGLEQVRSRLELLYPGRYTWTYGANRENTEYSSLLVLHTKNNS